MNTIYSVLLISKEALLCALIIAAIIWVETAAP